ncbi:MAG: hypothetical protein Q7S77_01830 [Candidatus Staskawiczbacteria bacterium]|nr:hypothetical protein [Candidatus Staskawiczbacteria bacterium]
MIKKELGRLANNIGTKNNSGLKKFPAEGGAEKRAGKNSFPLNPFLFARPIFLVGVRGLRPRLSLLNFLNSFFVSPCLWQASL